MILLFVWSGFVFVCFVGIWLFGMLRWVGFIVFWGWLVKDALGMVLFIFFQLVLLRLGFSGILVSLLGFGLVFLLLAIWLVRCGILKVLFLKLGVIRSLRTFVVVRAFVVVLCWMFMAPCSFLLLLMFEKEIKLCLRVSWLVVSGTVFFSVVFVVSLFLVGFVGRLMGMVICSGNVPFLLLLRFVKILNFMIS